jgi:hypothetical protein
MATAQENLGKKIFNSLTKKQRAMLINKAGLNDYFTSSEKSQLLNGELCMGASSIEKVANSNPYSALAVSAVKVFGKLFKKKKKKGSDSTNVITTTTPETKKSSIPIIPIAIGAGVIVVILIMKKK